MKYLFTYKAFSFIVAALVIVGAYTLVPAKSQANGCYGSCGYSYNYPNPYSGRYYPTYGSSWGYTYHGRDNYDNHGGYGGYNGGYYNQGGYGGYNGGYNQGGYGGNYGGSNSGHYYGSW